MFARSYNAADVRRRATVDYINKPVKIDGKTINPGDLIFIDECAMVVIYKKYEQEVIKRVLDVFYNEKAIVNDIVNNKHIDEILENRGTF